MTRSENGQTKPAYRVTMVGNEKQQTQKGRAAAGAEGRRLFDRTPAASPTTAARRLRTRGRMLPAILTLSASTASSCTCGLEMPKCAMRSRRIRTASGRRTTVPDPDLADRRAGSGLFVRIPRGFWRLPGCMQRNRRQLHVVRHVRGGFHHHGVPYIRSIVSLVAAPATLMWRPRDSFEAAGRHDIQFDLIDIDYRSFLVQTCTSIWTT